MSFDDYVHHAVEYMHLEPKRESAWEIWSVVEATEMGIIMELECVDSGSQRANDEALRNTYI